MAKKSKRMKRKPGRTKKVRNGRKPKPSRRRAVKQRKKKNKKPQQSFAFSRFAALIKKKEPERQLRKFYYELVPNWSIDDRIAVPKTTFLLGYKDGGNIDLNVRLQFHHDTFSYSSTVDSRQKLQRELMDVIRNSKPDVDDEINYLKLIGVPTSFLLYDCSSYSYGSGAPPSLIEIIYSTK